MFIAIFKTKQTWETRIFTNMWHAKVWQMLLELVSHAKNL